MKNSKTKRVEAEYAAEWYARETLGCVLTRRPVRTKWQAVDFFGADVLGKLGDGSTAWVQVTAGDHSCVSERRRKLEGVPWNSLDIVRLLQLRSTEDPANGRRRLWWFRVHLFESGVWSTLPDAVAVPNEWFKAWREQGGAFADSREGFE